MQKQRELDAELAAIDAVLATDTAALQAAQAKWEEETLASPPAAAFLLEKSLDGLSWSPLQYYADDCEQRFNMVNNAPRPSKLAP